jgi:hypothetical protein
MLHRLKAGVIAFDVQRRYFLGHVTNVNPVATDHIAKPLLVGGDGIQTAWEVVFIEMFYAIENTGNLKTCNGYLSVMQY